MSKKMKAVYTIIESETLERPLFLRIGTAFVNRDSSLNVLLDAHPTNGKLHIRDIELRAESAAQPATGGGAAGDGDAGVGAVLSGHGEPPPADFDAPGL